ncbi:unnamed protein product [Caenorhabditis auriculariae]|uniref:Peptidase M13 N-terminal domain-containing protein n=1 Tax=Caenorhabditis auriculariae TaxID=2777116 RepID=A0A8S1HBY0_9PELO|nr:unnamed protein product [Caenorhabditis auriculariae]
MLDWYSGEFNLIMYDRDVHPQDRSKLVLQLRPPNLEKIIGGVKMELVQLAKPSETELEPLLQLSIRQNVLNEFVRQQLLRDPRDVQAQLDEVAQLMVELDSAAAISSRMTPNTTYMTFKQLFEAIPQLDLRGFLNAGLSTVYHWAEEDTVSIQNFEYLARLANIMASTSRRAVANYLLTVTAMNLKQYSYFPSEQFSWRECVEQLSQLEVVSKLYIEQFRRFDRSEVSQYLQTLKTDFLSTHRNTPLQYLSTINRLGFYVGFPKRLLDEDSVWMPLSQLSLDLTDYFNSIVRVSKEERNFALSQIGTYLDSDDAPKFPVLSADMLFDPHLGAIVLPMSFLQAPIYVPGDDVPMYGVYSSLGVTVLQMIAKVFWQGVNQNSQLQCLDNVFRGFLGPDRQNSVNLDKDLIYTIELSDAFKTTLYGYAKWQNDHSIHHEKTLPAYDKFDSISSLIVTFSTLFCNLEGIEPGSDYEAMMNTVASNSRQYSINFHCSNSSRIFNRRTCV